MALLCTDKKIMTFIMKILTASPSFENKKNGLNIDKKLLFVLEERPIVPNMISLHTICIFSSQVLSRFKINATV